MKVLTLKTREGTQIVNLDTVQLIATSQVGAAPFLDIAFVRSSLTIPLGYGVNAADVLQAVLRSLSPMYEGRMNNVLGIRLDLDLTPYQVDAKPKPEEPF